MTVARILAAKGKDVVTTQPHRTLAEAAGILTARNIGAVVVADAQGRVLGILWERDIVHAIGGGGAAALNDAVSKHMTTAVVTAHEDESVDLTMEKMTVRRCRHLPVVFNAGDARIYRDRISPPGKTQGGANVFSGGSAAMSPAISGKARRVASRPIAISSSAR